MPQEGHMNSDHQPVPDFHLCVLEPIELRQQADDYPSLYTKLDCHPIRRVLFLSRIEFGPSLFC